MQKNTDQTKRDDLQKINDAMLKTYDLWELNISFNVLTTWKKKDEKRLTEPENSGEKQQEKISRRIEEYEKKLNNITELIEKRKSGQQAAEAVEVPLAGFTFQGSRGGGSSAARPSRPNSNRGRSSDIPKMPSRRP